MALDDLLDGGSLTGRQAGVILTAWLGIVLVAGVLLVVNLPS